MAKTQRVVDNAYVNSPHDVKSIEHNPASGGQKSLPVGPHLLPIQIAGGYTTDVSSAAKALPFIGANLAIYNNAGTVGTVTIGGAGVTSQLIGVSDVNGNVGVACKPNDWTYLSMGYNQWIISSAATLFVYIIEDPTRIIQESGPYAQQNVNGIIPIS